MKKLFDLTGAVALVTGSTKGIGKAMAEALAAHGARLVVTSRREAACREVAASFRARGWDAHPIPCNVSRRAELEALVAATRAHYGPIDVLICNAAANPFHGSSLDIPDSAFEKVLRVNIESPHWLCQLVIPEMRERGGGAIILVSSIGGLRGSTRLGAYAASKAALMQLARNLATEFGPDNIRVNCVAPGLVRTDFARALWENPRVAKARVAETPLRRLGEPLDCAGIAVYLASAAGAWTTGQTIAVDGGGDDRGELARPATERVPDRRARSRSVGPGDAGLLGYNGSSRARKKEDLAWQTVG